MTSVTRQINNGLNLPQTKIAEAVKTKPIPIPVKQTGTSEKTRLYASESIRKQMPISDIIEDENICNLLDAGKINEARTYANYINAGKRSAAHHFYTRIIMGVTEEDAEIQAQELEDLNEKCRQWLNAAAKKTKKNLDNFCVFNLEL